MGIAYDPKSAHPLHAARFDRREAAGAVADLGVLLPIAVALIVVNGLSPTAVLLPAGLLYLAAGALYRLPVPVQPLKAFGAIAIAQGLSADAIAAGALLMGAIFLALGRTGLLDRVARVFPQPVIRGVQLAVGLLFLEIAWRLVTDPPEAFAAYAPGVTAGLLLTAGGVGALLVLRHVQASLTLVALGLVVMLVTAGDALAVGPSPLEVPSPDLATLGTAFTVLVIPQLPLTFANSCLATADAARSYFGEAARRVTPGRLATSLGAANVFAGAIGGMPCCHGAGGLTAHRSFGARTGGAPALMGGALVLVAVLLGAGLAGVLPAFPLPILAALLVVAGLLHIGLLRDLRGPRAWGVALLVGTLGVTTNLSVGLVAGLTAWWLSSARRGMRS